MGGISVAERSSLDRLKALDSLPDLDSQLQEAKSLCNHSSRAEMILRWLLGKLKASDEARQENACWELLSSCLRIISTSRIAFLLGSNGFIDILQTTSSATDLSLQLMHAIASTLIFLLDISEREPGASIKSLLTIDSSIAATICSTWIGHVYQAFCNYEERTTALHYSLLRPALRVWSLRKRSDSDNDLFNSTCLVVVMLLLRHIHNNADVSSHKRKRDGNGVFDAREAVSTLESMVAKHIILPARTVFFKERESQARQSRVRRAETTQPGIKERLGSLKMAMLREQDQRLVQSIPFLFDIALRSVATPTPKHRFNERPWLESLLTALRACFSSQDRGIRNRALAEMLLAIDRQDHMLSLQTLSTVVKDDALPTEVADRADWRLIAAAVKLDANVFCDGSMLKALFNAITSASESRPDNDLSSLLTDCITSPVVKAHAKSRTLATFVDCWSEQLQRSENQSSQSIFSNIAASFAEVCEEAMTTEQLVLLFDKLALDVDELADRVNLSDDLKIHNTLNASLVVLRGLLAGVRSAAVITRLQRSLEKLNHSLQTLASNKNAKIPETLPYQLWSLLTRVFKLCFPSWAIQQGSRSDVVEKGLTKTLRDAFNTAMSQCAGQDGSEEGACNAQSAQIFVATICSCFVRYTESKECEILYRDGVECLGRQRNAALPMFAKFPSLFNELRSSSRKQLVSEFLASASEEELSKRGDHGSFIASLQALVYHVSFTPDQAVLGDIVTTTVEHLKEGSTRQHAAETEVILLSVLLVIDLAKLKVEERVEILDTLLDLQPPQSTEWGSIQLQHRLAFMVGLLRHSCRGARLLATPEGMWEIVSLFKGSEASDKTAPKPAHPLDSLENLEIFDELVKCLIRSWLTSQSQKSSSDVFEKFSDQTKKRVKELRAGSALASGTRTASLVLFKNFFGLVGGENLKANGRQDSEAVNLFLSALAGELKSIISPSADRPSLWTSGAQSGPLLWIFDSLAALPDGLKPSPSRVELADGVKALAYSVLNWDDPRVPEKGFQDRSKFKVASFRVACKYAPTAGSTLLPVAKKLLERDLTAREYETVLSTFEEAFEADDDEWTGALHRLIKDGEPQTPAALILQQKSIKVLTDEDLEGSPTGTGHLRGTGSFTAFQIFDHTIKEAAHNTNLQAKHIALETMLIVLKEKPFMINQYGIEQTLTTLQNLLFNYSHASSLYTDITNIFATLFAAHRPRLQGRFHLLVPLFQALLTTLFTTPLPSHTTQLNQARSLARLLESFCNPHIRPRSSKSTKTTTSLIDESRKAQARAGQYSQYILHHYCSLILAHSDGLKEGVREALMPGLWTVIEAMESYNKEAVRVLSSAMNASERAVLRGVYEGWKRFGRWEGL